ncbi:MAG: phage tail tape measure protein, partial [Candidatus Curtissbacteria bacterium]|nr:phage tail tape measure protein [Candidatus Curtissbacteria bacterium]
VISSDLNQFQKSLHAATSRVLSFGLTVGILFSVKRAFSGLIKETIAVEKSLKDINVILNLNEKSLTSFGNQLFKIAKETGQSFKNIADAGAELARQGLGVTETLKRAKDAAILSRLANQSLEESVESITAGLNSFNESILTSTDLVNKFARVDAAYAVSSRDFAEAVRRVGSTAQDAGVSVEELIGVVTSLQQTTARGGSIIGNSLKTIFTKVQTTGVLEQLERLGITVRGMGDEFLPTLEVLKNLGLEFDKLGKQDQTKAAQLVGNLYQINQVRALAKDLEKAENSVMSKATALARQPGNEAILRNIELNKTLAAELNRTAENIRQVFAEFGKTGIGSGLGFLLGGVNTTLEKLIPSNSDEIGSKFGKGFLKGLGDYVIGPGGVGLGLILVSTFVKVLKDVRTGLKTFTFINKLARENAELQTFTASKYIAQKTTIDLINSSSQQRLATENSILGTIQAQNAALSRSTLAGVGIKKGRLGGVPPENAGQFGTGQLFGAMSPAGGGMGFSVNPTSYYSLSGRGAIPSAPVKPLTPITQIANLTRRINQIDRLRQQATDPQILRIAEEERRIASQELGFLRLQNRTANQSFSDTQAQRESIAKGPQAERMNIFSSLHARRREQSVGIQEQVSLNESRQTAFAALDDRDRREAIKQKNDIKRLQRRDDAAVGGSYMFGFKDRHRLETMAKKGVPGASAALSEARLRVSEKLQSRAFGLSFGGPILGNLAAETLA